MAEDAGRISSGILVARYLKSYGYIETLESFLREANLPSSAGDNDDNDGFTVDKILSEKKRYDLTVNFEKLRTSETNAWTRPSPRLAIAEKLPQSGNVLQVGLLALRDSPDGEIAAEAGPKIFELVSTVADKAVRLIPFDRDNSEVIEFHADSPVLSYTVIHKGRRLLYLTISGNLGLYDVAKREIYSNPVRYHAKFGVRITTEHFPEQGILIATAGWDRKVQLAFLPHDLDSTDDDAKHDIELPQPTTTILLDTLPEDLVFKRHPDTHQLYLVLSRRDSTFLYYYAIDVQLSESTTEAEQNDHTSKPIGIKASLAGKQNLAPYSNSWTTFSPSCLASSPSDPNLIAVATSSIPHMKVLLVRLLYPDTHPEEDGPAHQDNEEAVSSRESMAIVLHANALVGQTAYSVPLVVWRPDGSGFWVNSDDGFVKGIDLNGRVVETLTQGGHEAGTRVRCLFAGYVSGNGENGRTEVLLSGGFDQQMIRWEIPR